MQFNFKSQIYFYNKENIIYKVNIFHITLREMGLIITKIVTSKEMYAYHQESKITTVSKKNQNIITWFL